MEIIGYGNVLTKQVHVMHLENRNTAELHFFGSWLSVSPIIRISLAFRVNLPRIPQN